MRLSLGGISFFSSNSAECDRLIFGEQGEQHRPDAAMWMNALLREGIRAPGVGAGFNAACKECPVASAPSWNEDHIHGHTALLFSNTRPKMTRFDTKIRSFFLPVKFSYISRDQPFSTSNGVM